MSRRLLVMEFLLVKCSECKLNHVHHLLCNFVHNLKEEKTVPLLKWNLFHNQQKLRSFDFEAVYITEGNKCILLRFKIVSFTTNLIHRNMKFFCDIVGNFWFNILKEKYVNFS